MASIQKISSMNGHRIYWRLCFPNGTYKEKYKASTSRSILERILPEILLIEMLSQRNSLMSHDVTRACHLRIITRTEAKNFNISTMQLKDREAEETKIGILKELNEQLHSATEKLFKINQEIEERSRQNAVILAQHMEGKWDQWKARFVPNKYPDPPPGMISPTINGIGVPATSGIYFIWKNDTIIYVGQSVNMKRRVTLHHGAIHENSLLSFVPIKEDELVWAECYYIGMLRPNLNRNTPIPV